MRRRYRYYPETLWEWIVEIAFLGLGISLIVGSCNYSLESDKKVKEEKKKLELKLAEDANVEKFNMDYFGFNEDDNKYFFTFTGTAVKTSGEPIEFISTKYCISEKNYYEFMAEIGTNKQFEEKLGIFSKILDIVSESELINNSEIEKLPTSIINKDTNEEVVLKNITIPKIIKEKDVAVYEVEMFKFNKEDKNSPSIEFIKKQVVVPLNKQIEENPCFAFNTNKEDCKVRTLSKSIEAMKNNKFLNISNSR